MSFGFSEDKNTDGKPKELEHNLSQTLKWQGWEPLFVGLKVQSVLNKAKGHISLLDKKYNLVYIDWDNGNKSRASLSDLTKVIVNNEPLG